MKKIKYGIFIISIIIFCMVICIHHGKEKLLSNSYTLIENEINKTENEEILEERILNIEGNIIEKNQDNTYSVSLNFSTDKCIKNIYDITNENNKISILNENAEIGQNVVVRYNMLQNQNYKFEVEMASGFKFQKDYQLDIPTNITPKILIGGQIVTLTKENVVDYYGQEVINYNGSTIATWRLFYVDFDGKYGQQGKIYLKADEVTTANYNAQMTVISTNALNKMKSMNPKWAENDGTMDADNEKFVMYLSNESYWYNFKNVDKADYVMGAPSLEMYQDSYNQYHTKKGTSGYEKLKCNWFELNASGYKYMLESSSANDIYYPPLVKDKNNMYINPTQTWCLASPCAEGANMVCDIYGIGLILGRNAIQSYALCPVAELKGDFIPEISELTVPITVAGQTVNLTRENASDFYGKVVTNYDSSTTITWRLFFIDFYGKYGELGKIYLIGNQTGVGRLDNSVSVSSERALEIMKKINPAWNEKDGVINTNGEKSTMYLCDETKWSVYKNTEKADWAIASPSIEMYIDSYNQFNNTKITCTTPKINGYSFYTGNNYLNADTYNMYTNSTRPCWLSSPSCENNDSLCAIMNGTRSLNYRSYENYQDYRIMPLVCLKTDFQLEISN